MTILDAMHDPQLFGETFAPNSWQPWRQCAATVFGLPPDDPAFVRQCIGYRQPPREQVREAWLVCGRRAGKSVFVALVAVYLACFRSYRLSRGERGVFMVLAADRRQARVVIRYIKAFLHGSPLLHQMVSRETQTEVELTNGVTIEIHTASFRSVRGYTLVGAICDEIAYWPTDESASPDAEVLNALRPAMATVPNALLLCISSPYAQRGELWRAYRDHYGQDGDVLVWQAATRTMNETVPQSIIDTAYENDPAIAASEFGAEFRSDLEALFTRDAVDGCVTANLRERPVAEESYRAFVDPSGGSNDSMTLAIAHTADEQQVLDVVREVRPPFSPEGVVEEFAALLTTYRIGRVKGDRYGGEWPRERFRKHGITYDPADKTRSELYLALLPMVNSGQVNLLDHSRLIAQLVGLERRTGRGRDHIDHAPGAHDDLANAAAGALVTTVGPTYRVRSLAGPEGMTELRASTLVSRMAGLSSGRTD